jgi:hypothetical protein
MEVLFHKSKQAVNNGWNLGHKAIVRFNLKALYQASLKDNNHIFIQHAIKNIRHSLRPFIFPIQRMNPDVLGDFYFHIINSKLSISYLVIQYGYFFN